MYVKNYNAQKRTMCASCREKYRVCVAKLLNIFSSRFFERKRERINAADLRLTVVYERWVFALRGTSGAATAIELCTRCKYCRIVRCRRRAPSIFQLPWKFRSWDTGFASVHTLNTTRCLRNRDRSLVSLLLLSSSPDFHRRSWIPTTRSLSRGASRIDRRSNRESSGREVRREGFVAGGRWTFLVLTVVSRIHDSTANKRLARIVPIDWLGITSRL